jgi:hypothetical protein
VLRLLRPAESAARRLVIVAARGIVVELPAARPRKPKSKPTSAFLRKPGGTGILLPGGLPPQADLSRPVRRAALPLCDPPRRLARCRRRPVASGIPRISVPGMDAPFPVPVRRPLSPFDPIDAMRLALRLAALASALDDLPGHARRFARWRSRRDRSLGRGRAGRPWPLKPGRPPGQFPGNSRRSAHEVYGVLAELHWFAFEALEHPDTS